MNKKGMLGKIIGSLLGIIILVSLPLILDQDIEIIILLSFGLTVIILLSIIFILMRRRIKR